jgi:hypothetical protein
MAEIVQSLFGVTPQAYQQAQQDRMDAQALQYAKLDPFQQANYAIGRGASGLAGAIGGALGGQDPELQRITMRQQIAGQLNPNDLSTFDRGIEMLRQGGDGQGAMMLTMEKDKARQLAQERQLNTLKTEDYLTQRGQGIQAKGLEQLANELVAKMKRPDGTLDQDVVNQLRSFPQGMAAITAQAKILPDLRKLGATAAAPEDNPFVPFTTDATLPKNVKAYADQLSKSFIAGNIDPEKVDTTLKGLSEMAQRAQQFQQNQDQITSNQKLLADLRSQGLDNSRQSLLLQQQQAQLAQDNATYKRETQQAELIRKEEERKNKPLPSYLAKDEAADYETAQAATNIAFDANNYINKIKAGDVKFGLKEKASIRARQVFGSSDPDVVAREDYDKFIRTLVNESLRLNKGTQTEGDATRVAKELESSESPQAAASAMRRLVDINLRRTQDAAKSVVTRRTNQGFPEPPRPIEVPKFDLQIIDNREYQSFLKNPKYPSGTTFVDPDGVRRVKP